MKNRESIIIPEFTRRTFLISGYTKQLDDYAAALEQCIAQLEKQLKRKNAEIERLKGEQENRNEALKNQCDSLRSQNEALLEQLDSYSLEETAGPKVRDFKTGRYTSTMPKKQKILVCSQMNSQGYSLQEIARALRVTTATVKRYLYLYAEQEPEYWQAYQLELLAE